MVLNIWCMNVIKPIHCDLSRRRFLATGALVGIGTALGGPGLAAAPLDVVATTGMIADAVVNLGGGAVRVRALMGPGVDPHSYRQTRSDIVAMTRADLVVWHGLYLEAQMQAFFDNLSRRGTVYAAAEVLPRDMLRGHDDYDDKFDPHVWMDTALWQHVVAGIRDALIKAHPEMTGQITANAQRYAAEIAQVGAYAAKVLATVPARDRVLLTAHDAFGYFGQAHGFEVLGIQGISTESEAGLNRIGSLVETIVSRGIRAVFVESSVSDRNIRALIEGARARGHDVRVGGELYSDAMGAPGTYEGTYLGMIDHNATTIARALGGATPQGGMRGLLRAQG